MAYGFDLLGPRHDALFVHKMLSTFQAEVGDGWPSWALSNHDCTRLATRWAGAAPGAVASLAELKAFAALQLGLRGSPCLYQGDELGLPEAEIAFDDLQDPYGKTMWPRLLGRDGCRTPMPWQAAAPDMGFGHGAAAAGGRCPAGRPPRAAAALPTAAALAARPAGADQRRDGVAAAASAGLRPGAQPSRATRAVRRQPQRPAGHLATAGRLRAG